MNGLIDSKQKVEKAAAKVFLLLMYISTICCITIYTVDYKCFKRILNRTQIMFVSCTYIHSAFLVDVDRRHVHTYLG